MDLSSSALIVVDMQNGFVRSRSQHVVPAIVQLLEEWKKVGGDVVFTRYLNYENSPYERLIGWKRRREVPEAELIPELAPYVSRIDHARQDDLQPVHRRGCGARRRARLDRPCDLRIATESCVCKIAVDAFERDLTPWVVTDACASHAGQEAHDAGLLVTSRFIGHKQLITSHDLLGQTLRVPGLMGRANCKLGAAVTQHTRDQSSSDLLRNP